MIIKGREKNCNKIIIWYNTTKKEGIKMEKYMLSDIEQKHTNYYAETAEQHKKFTSEKMPKEKIWFCDPEGLGTPGYGLCMSAEEMAKIGLICLNNDSYNGKQIVSSSWIEEITRPRIVEGKNFRGIEYDYLW